MNQSINIAFSTTDGLFSRLIRWFSRSKVSHSIITFRDETLDKIFVMEANGRGFMLVPWAKWSKSNTLVARYSLNVNEEEQIFSLRLLADSLGVKYDYLSLFGFVLRRFKSRMANPFDDSKKLVCSEAVARFLNGVEDGEHLIFNDPSSWTPEDILSEINGDRRNLFVLEESIDTGSDS